MGIVLAKFSNLGELTYDQVDNNWQLIEDALNAGGGQPIYSIVNGAITNTCEPDGVNNATLNAQIKILTPPAINPILKTLVTLNGNIVAAENNAGYFMGCAYPFVANTVGGEAFDTRILIPADGYPATIKIYVFDENANYSIPQTILIQDNPCAAPAESIVINSAVVVTGPPKSLTLNVDIANGSNDFIPQWFDGTVWHNLAAFVQLDGTGIVLSVLSDVSGSRSVRVQDALTLNISNSVTVNFA